MGVKPPSFAKNFLQSLNSQSSSAEQIAVFDSLWDSVIRAVDDTVRSGRSDLGAAIVYRGGKWTGLAGVQLANASTLDPPLRMFLASVAGEDAKVRIRLDAERLADMTFHTVSGPIEAENPLRVFFGERLDIAFGLRPEAAYLAFGAQPIAIIKEAVGRSALAISKPIPPLELRLSVGKLAQMVAATSQEPLPSQARAIATQAQAGSGRDQVTLTLDRVSDGLRCRIRAEEGLLRVLVAAWASAIPR